MRNAKKKAFLHFPTAQIVYCRHMKHLLTALILALAPLQAMAMEFIGKWEVYSVEYPDDYYGEIKYPKYFELLESGDKLVGYYKDQFDYECKFPLSELVNGGNELLLMVCGTTKWPQSWAPLNKVKLIDGELVGVVLTNDKQFTWHAKAVKRIPLTIKQGATQPSMSR